MSKTILNEIADFTRKRYEKRIAEKPLESVKTEALAMPKGNFEFEKALRKKVFHLFARLRRQVRQKVLLHLIFRTLQLQRNMKTQGQTVFPA